MQIKPAFRILTVQMFVSVGICSSLRAQEWENSPYFDTSFLTKYENVHAAMLKDGFTDVRFKSDDGLILRGLLLERNNATYSLIVCCGFYPGRKEGMSTLFALLPNDCNLFFFDARGHGSSEGRFLSNLHNYGKEEFRDVLGAIAFMRERSSCPIIMYGICAGTFHATRALLYLQRYNALANYGIKGLVFDSGLSSILNSTSIPKKHFQNKVVPQLFNSYVYKKESKPEIREKLPYRIAWGLMSPCISGVEWCITKLIERHKDEISLMPAISQLECPTFFIHARNDSYTSFSDAESLAQQTPRATAWWIENSEHACNHLKHKHEYRQRMCAFIQHAISQ